MRPVTTFVVSPTLPPSLAPLKELAYNYWWCWNDEARDMFLRIDPVLWEEVHHNPVALLGRLPMAKLESLAERAEFVAVMHEVYANFRSYMEGRGAVADLDVPSTGYIAYFCAEFGVHESFMNYSGGLGVLAGDHLKSASDLGLPLVAVGLLYQEGYFRQYLTQNGWQNEQYAEIDFHTIPVTPVLSADGTPLTISVDLPLGTCHARIWRLSVGRVPLYLLDTNIPQNTDPTLRDVTDRLYGGTTDTRVMQELLLGIGGMRALEALGIDPAVVHVNEGHAAFSLLERTRMTMQRLGMPFRDAWRITQGSTVFTTHTPVPAGNEVFRHELLQTYLDAYVKGLGMTWNDFLRLGAQQEPDDAVGFSMTVLGLHGSAHRNGVSQLHGEVARTMWQQTWSGFSLDEVPVGAVTNGVHSSTWISRDMGELYDRYLSPQWRERPHDESLWASVEHIPNVELWRVHQRRRERLVVAAREHILHKHSASLTQEQAAHINDCLDPDVLTIGFARRFASYKRADLLMHDMERLARIVHDDQRPIQIVLAGKAHPRDTEGKELIQKVHTLIRQHGLSQRVVFLEDYDMSIARLMVRGCDVWLNTPRRPHEASGTSGMKAVLNGALHCSILDGWWAEAYDGENGFAIGRGEILDPDEQDAADAHTLYDMLEHVIVPLFYDRQKSRIPDGWIAMMKHSIRTNAWRFAAQRMVLDYARTSYVPAMRRHAEMTADGGRLAREASAFVARVDGLWPHVRVEHVEVIGASGAHVGKTILVRARVALAGLQPSEVVVQAMHGHVDARGMIRPADFTTLTYLGHDGDHALYQGEYICSRSGVQGCTVRLVPTHPTFASLPDAARVVYANGH